MICPRCSTPTSGEARFCAACGSELRIDAGPSVAPDAVRLAHDEAVHPNAPASPDQDTTAELASTPPTVARPDAPDDRPVGATQTTIPVDALQGSDRSRRWLLAVVGTAAVVVVLGLAALVLMSGGDDPDAGESAIGTSDAEATDSGPIEEQSSDSGGVSTVASPAAGATLTSVPVTTIVVAATTTTTTTVAPTTIAPTTLAPTIVASPPALPNVVWGDPLPSGLSWAEIQPSLTIAQELATALSNGDWDRARALEPAKRDSTNQSYEDGYRDLDQAQLMLRDARRENGGHRLLVASIANELNWTRTTVWCLEWTVYPAAGTLTQNRGVLGNVYQVPSVFTPDDVRADAGLDETVRTRCHWA